MIIEVEEKHIAQANRHSQEHCPLSLAVKERLPDCVVSVHGLNTEFGLCVYINHKPFKLSKEDQDRLINFDIGNGLTPFTCRLGDMLEDRCD